MLKAFANVQLTTTVMLVKQNVLTVHTLMELVVVTLDTKVMVAKLNLVQL